MEKDTRKKEHFLGDMGHERESEGGGLVVLWKISMQLGTAYHLQISPDI